MSAIEITQVNTRKEMKDFIHLPWDIYRGDPHWVPPLKKEMAELLDPERHPFWRFSERALFMVKRGSRSIGRIAAIIDHTYNRFHQEKMGIWGFFECEDDLEAAKALFTSVEGWTRDRGMAFLRGPLNPSTNYGAGLLVEGFGESPAFLMTYNPPFYVSLVEACGLVKEKDLLGFRVDEDYRLPEGLQRMIQRMKDKYPFWIRTMDSKNFEREATLIKKLYHEGWSRNWGFVPLTDEEFRHLAKKIGRLMEPEHNLFMGHGEEEVGVAMGLQDINPILKRLNGRIGLTGLLKILLYRKEIKGIRGFMMGLKDGYRELGLPLLALDHILEQRKKTRKYRYIEFGWNLEDNVSINQWYEEAGLRPTKRFRIYRKSL